MERRRHAAPRAALVGLPGCLTEMIVTSLHTRQRVERGMCKKFRRRCLTNRVSNPQAMLQHRAVVELVQKAAGRVSMLVTVPKNAALVVDAHRSFGISAVHLRHFCVVRLDHKEQLRIFTTKLEMEALRMPQRNPTLDSMHAAQDVHSRLHDRLQELGRHSAVAWPMLRGQMWTRRLWH